MCRDVLGIGGLVCWVWGVLEEVGGLTREFWGVFEEFIFAVG